MTDLYRLGYDECLEDHQDKLRLADLFVAFLSADTSWVVDDMLLVLDGRVLIGTTDAELVRSVLKGDDE